MPPSAPSLNVSAWLERQLQGRATPAVLIVVGFGDGSLLDAIEAMLPNSRILALEPDRAQASRFTAHPRGARWRAEGRLVYLADPDYTGADDAWRIFPSRRHKPVVLTHPELRRGEGLPRAKEVLKRILFNVEANAAARRRFAPRYLTNTLRNVPAMMRGSDISCLADAYRGRPAIIAGAGPSLARSIATLQHMGDRALIVAADTALRPLLTGGITPHLVVGMDPGAANLRHFLALPECQRTWLVAESALDPGAVARFGRRSLWFRLADHQPWPWLNAHGFDIGKLDVWGSVLTGAFQVACLAGCDPIVAVGADLAFSYAQPYTRGTTYEFDWARSAGHGMPMADSWRIQRNGLKTHVAPDLAASPVETTDVLRSYRDWMVARAKRSGRRVINASGAGILFGDGIEQGALDAVITAPAGIADVERLARPAAAEIVDRFSREFRQLLDHASKHDMSPDTLRRWADFSGDAFQLSDVEAALAAAMASLEDATEAPVLDGAARFVRHYAVDTASLALPEAMLRLWSGLNCRTPLPGGDDEADEQRQRLLLGETLEQLVDLCAALERADVQPLTDLDAFGHLPVALRYTWSDEQRWAIQLFEARLGAAWSPAAHETTPTFFARYARVRAADPESEPKQGPVPLSPAARACRELALEWFQCLRGVPSAVQGAAERLKLIESHLYLEPAASASGIDHAEIVVVNQAGATATFPVAASEPALARVLTGTLRPSTEAPHTLVRLAHNGGHATLALRRAKSTASAVEWPAIAPIVLTDRGLPRAAVAYALDDAVVCVRPHQSQSIAIRADGTHVPQCEWPRPIVGQLPWGEHGAVAWGDGLSRFPHTSPGYVMYRQSPDAAVTVEHLPCRPTTGAWWQGRLYWSCWPRRIASWNGVASWAPGSGLQMELPGFPPILGLHANAEGLRLEPIELGANLQLEKEALTWGWSWIPCGSPVPSRMGPDGAAVSQATAGEWTATAHAATDAIVLRAADGRERRLTCYNAFHLAWLGSSLLVSNVEREVLLFENLLHVIDDLR